MSTAELDKDHADVSQKISDAEAFYKDLVSKSYNPEFSVATQNKYSQMAKDYKPRVDEFYRTRMGLTTRQNEMAQRNKQIDELNGIIRSAGGLLGGTLLPPEEIQRLHTAIMNGEWDSTPSSQSVTPPQAPAAPAPVATPPTQAFDPRNLSAQDKANFQRWTKSQFNPRNKDDIAYFIARNSGLNDAQAMEAVKNRLR